MPTVMLLSRYSDLMKDRKWKISGPIGFAFQRRVPVLQRPSRGVEIAVQRELIEAPGGIAPSSGGGC